MINYDEVYRTAYDRANTGKEGWESEYERHAAGLKAVVRSAKESGWTDGYHAGMDDTERDVYEEEATRNPYERIVL